MKYKRGDTKGAPKHNLIGMFVLLQVLLCMAWCQAFIGFALNNQCIVFIKSYLREGDNQYITKNNTPSEQCPSHV